MPIPKPRRGEKHKQFIVRCIGTLAKTEKDRFTNKQRIAICFQSWRKTRR